MTVKILNTEKEVLEDLTFSGQAFNADPGRVYRSIKNDYYRWGYSGRFIWIDGREFDIGTGGWGECDGIFSGTVSGGLV